MDNNKVTVTTFEDGERIIIVTEGVPYETIKKLVGELHGVSFTPVKPIEAEPVTVDADISDIIAIIDEVKFEDGPYKDKKPEEIINDPEAFIWLLNSLKNDALSPQLKETSYKTIKINLAEKFKNADPATYPDKLTERQITIFLNRYSYALPKENLEEIANKLQSNDIEEIRQSDNIDIKKETIKAILNYILS